LFTFLLEGAGKLRYGGFILFVYFGQAPLRNIQSSGKVAKRMNDSIN
jgi:hypothetical protein